MRKNKVNGYYLLIVLEHRLVWEQANNACLLKWSDVHHKNGIKTDNRPENLEAMMKRHHTILNKTKDMSNRKCFYCGNNKSYNRKWYRITLGYACGKCQKGKK